ncbi:hypothetical protein D3C72_2319810 [compost metagenome]
MAGDEVHRPFVVDLHLTEEVDVRDKVSLSQAPFAELNQEPVSRVPVHCIAMLLVGLGPVLLFDEPCIRDAANGVVPGAVRRGD